MARVLIAATDAKERSALARAYRVSGNAVVEAGDAGTCLDFLEKTPPEALVLDPRLPGLEASQLLRHIRRNPELASMKVSLLAHGMDAALWEFLGRQFFDLVVEGEGAQAGVELAADPSRAGARRAPKGGDAPAAGKDGAETPKGRILVVEDEPSYCILLGTEFQAHGWETIGADSAEAALEMLVKEKVDAVLSDINLPGINGCDLAHRIRVGRPDLKIVLMTGMPKDRYPTPPKGVPILPKPISVLQLMAAMRFL